MRQILSKKIIHLTKDELNEKGFRYANISEEDAKDCIGCAMCATMCPDVCITVER